MGVAIERLKAADAEAVYSLLREHQLPVDGLADHLETTLVARDGRGRVLGSAALEIYGNHALLRSVAVAGASRGQHIGRDLTLAALRLAAERSVSTVYLLTTTADDYFPRFGFERIARAEVPAAVQSSVEFTTACPSSATVMRKRL